MNRNGFFQRIFGGIAAALIVPHVKAAPIELPVEKYSIKYDCSCCDPTSGQCVPAEPGFNRTFTEAGEWIDYEVDGIVNTLRSPEGTKYFYKSGKSTFIKNKPLKHRFIQPRRSRKQFKMSR